MYEENLQPLPPGDATRVFADILGALQRDCGVDPPLPLSPDAVVHWARQDIQPYFAKIGRRLLLPGSGIGGLGHLASLAELAAQGEACLLCLNHRSNLDVPTLYALLEDHDRLELFHRLIWIAGRKLHEDEPWTQIFVQAYNRVIVTPHSWLRPEHTDEDHHAAQQINLAALRAIRELRPQGWVFALFPTGTRERPDDPRTACAIEEIDSYLKNFEHIVLGHVDGCTLPVTRDRDLAHETPQLDRICFTFSPVQRTQEWREEALRRYPGTDQRTASALAIMRDIAALTDGADCDVPPLT